MDSLNLSSIDKASFMDALLLNDGNPLHSTALDEGLNAGEERQDGGKLGRPPKKGKGKGAQQDGEGRKRRSTGVKAKTGLKRGAGEKGAGEKVADRDVKKKKSIQSSVLPKSRLQVPTAEDPLVGKNPTSGKTARSSAKRTLVKSRPLKNQESETESDGKTIGGVLQEESDSDIGEQIRRSLQFAEEKDDDAGRDPSPQKGPQKGTASGRTEKAKGSRRTRKGHCSQEGTNLEVMLDAFLDYSDQYRKSVDSAAVKESIEDFSNKVKTHLLDQISSYEEVGVLNKDCTRVGSLIRTKTQRLFDAKYELMRAERKEGCLQKERVELQQRLTHLRRGQAFLGDITAMTRMYLDQH
ncbi:uncharacterized protein LOC133447690 [Cololabis saira]|uniref:uncharacterized protein LOC133447690 n=1 Tax=Cololabis saira TaxID=129043 RepID=UPI002AD34E40|nr:uncharacterized protein LOC133447690 [Cololabis saira]XP_061582406.1 uncharacterized protein LOC133447690 [Cololabis saira]